MLVATAAALWPLDFPSWLNVFTGVVQAGDGMFLAVQGNMQTGPSVTHDVSVNM